MNASEHRQLAQSLLSVVLSAARVQMSHFGQGIAVETKADSSPVTAADRESEEIIFEGLAQAAPGVPIVAEEAVTGGHVPELADIFFLVDPLDGTKGFIKGRQEFTINIALIRGGRASFGLVYAPALADFTVTLGPSETATARLLPNATVQSLADCDLRPARTRLPDPHALRALTSQSHLNRATAEFLERYNVVERTAMASSLKFCLIARGEADIYPRIAPTSEWDTAAGHAVLVAAGGAVTTLEGAPLSYGNVQRGFVNPAFVAWGRSPLPPRG
jgi:3'(2'), 5'-bisphosphate nucleotidase